MKKFFGLVAIASIAGISNAQVPTGTYRWQVSTDNGVTWDSEYFRGGPFPFKVRLLASWTGIPDAEGVGYGGGQFDATLSAPGIVGTVSNIQRPVPFNFAVQTLVATQVAGGIKVDTSADVAAPGAGTGWVNPGQGAHFSNPQGFNSSNGAVVFSFDLDSPGFDVTFSMVLNTTAGRAMAVYTNATGTQTRIDASNVTVIPAIDVTPAPGSLAVLGFGALAAVRRRRNS